jgi:hypothetical protein
MSSGRSSVSAILCVRQVHYSSYGMNSIGEKNCKLIRSRLPFPRAHLPVFGNIF